MASFLLPMAQYAAGSLRAGQLPLWNPHLYAGAPFAADIQSALFYPLNLAAYALVPRITYGWLEALSALPTHEARTSVTSISASNKVHPAVDLAHGDRPDD